MFWSDCRRIDSLRDPKHHKALPSSYYHCLYCVDFISRSPRPSCRATMLNVSCCMLLNVENSGDSQSCTVDRCWSIRVSLALSLSDAIPQSGYLTVVRFCKLWYSFGCSGQAIIQCCDSNWKLVHVGWKRFHTLCGLARRGAFRIPRQRLVPHVCGRFVLRAYGSVGDSIAYTCKTFKARMRWCCSSRLISFSLTSVLSLNG